MTIFRPRDDDMPKSLGVVLDHIWKGTIKCLAGFVACVSEATVGRGCKWVAWPLGIGGVLPMLVSSEILGIKPALAVFGAFVGVFGCVGQDWFGNTLESF